ncbi:Ribosomal RNA large subunit methyltransferase I [Maioricimonas rarisocia]|uniref:Ribosomal RNA large subunit methyltransferase I n=1 Tax=Maioricimonas rarisocia TaxID=2528026 RepID=A0A517Z875_9PLAN|nr:class I SAM-dependent rRNA methyltransferase [Maioricimonas rarisocia]QDU38665.1 Ribosomal RNA large subunit methyltransferase I [Maioricimonas rarisocia]
MTTDSAEAFPTVILKKRKALPFFSRHPWVFAGAIARVEGEPQPGDEVLLRSHEGQFIARGLFNPESNIRVRLYSWKEDQPLDREFWSARLDDAIALRKKLFGKPARGCRLVFSESDGLSGLTVDQYGEFLLVQWTSRALAARQQDFYELLNEKVKPRGIWQRTERGVGEAEGLAVADSLATGSAPPRPLFVEENGLQFGVDVVEGQKTGFYFDQRDNRAAVARYLKGSNVLDMFCYTGGFSIAAAKLGEARHVTGVDSSESALDMARRNAELNEVSSQVSFEQGDAFRTLESLVEEKKRFDAVILDPPKMARSRGGIERAARGYFSLNRLALDLLEPNGLLVTCSCSGLISREDFEQILAKVALDAGRSLQVLEVRGQAADHPVSVHCLETSYLKCFICRVV